MSKIADRSFLSELWKTAKRADGGSPLTIVCRDCHERINIGEVVDGPSRNRGANGEKKATWQWALYDGPRDLMERYNGHVDRNPTDAHHIRYWHIDCRNPRRIAGATTANTADTATAAAVTADTAIDVDALMAAVARLSENNRQALAAMIARLDAQDARIVNIEEREASAHDELARRIAAIESTRIVPTVVNVTHSDGTTTTTDVGPTHCQFEYLLTLCTDENIAPKDRNFWLAGPSGSGKSFTAEQIARALGVPFFTYGQVLDPYDLKGYVDPHGNAVRTPMYHAWTQPSVILYDEYSSWSPAATLVANNALSNGLMQFGGDAQPTKRHPQCIVLVGDNTYGFGNDARQGTQGRNVMDATNLDRFVTVDWPYDETLESRLCPHVEWRNVVRAVRQANVDNNGNLLASPRASIKGAQLLASGRYTREQVVQLVFGKYRKLDAWRTIGTAAENFAKGL